MLLWYLYYFFFFFFKQKTAYEMRISDWSSDVCSSDLFLHQKVVLIDREISAIGSANLDNRSFRLNFEVMLLTVDISFATEVEQMLENDFAQALEIDKQEGRETHRSEEHTSELQSLMRISYAVF